MSTLYYLQHPDEPEIQFKEHPSVTRHELRSRYGWLSPLLTQQTGYPFLKSDRIHQILDSKPYDVIHFHNISLLGPKILTINPNQGKAIKLYTTHEHWLVCPTHVLWKYNRRACEKPQCLPCTLMAKRPPQLWRNTGMLAEASRSVDLFVSPSRFTAQMHARRGFSRQVNHLPYFIERSDRDWQFPQSVPNERPYFLFVGRLETIKGVQSLIQIWDRVGDYDLLIAGTGNQLEALRTQAAENPHIRFLGALSQQELGNLYFHALATIVPSITYETFGIIIVESYARKTPVIVRDLGALPEVVEDSGGGLIYNTQDELLSSLQQIASSPEMRNNLGEKGYQKFLTSWTWEAHLELYYSLIQDVYRNKYQSDFSA